MMNRPSIYFLLTGLLLMACNSLDKETKDEGPPQLDISHFISLNTEINASAAQVWEIITDSTYAKIIGNEFDKGAYLDSDWKKDSKVHFTYTSGSIAATGRISELKESEFIQIDYDFDGFNYHETFKLADKGETTMLQVDAGPYEEDRSAQIKVWNNWLAKVKELSEER